MQHRFYGLRGYGWVAAYKAAYLELKPQIKEDFDLVLKTYGRFTPRDLGILCHKYAIPVKVMDEWLPEITNFVYPSGSWERSKLKPKDIGVRWSGSKK